MNTNSNGSSNGAIPLVDSGAALYAKRILEALPEPHPLADGVAVISHELRNSLSVVRNAARLLRVQFGADGIERARVLIERHVAQMGRQIEQLLDPSAFSRRLDVLLLSYVDLRTILEHSVEAIAPDCARRSHHLVVNLPVDALWVNVDAARLEQVFLNLLINAAKYTPDGGEIVLTLERLETHACVRVGDSGVGIPPAQLSHIFEMFVQVDATTKHAEGGRGIGLAVVRDLVEMHRGTVSAMSAGLNLGSEFTVLLPVSSAL